MLHLQLTDCPVLDIKEHSDDVTNLPPLAIVVANGRVDLLFVVAVVGPRHVVIAEFRVGRTSGKHPSDFNRAIGQDFALVVPVDETFWALQMDILGFINGHFRLYKWTVWAL